MQVRTTEKRMGERNRPGRRLLLSCLSRLILEPRCIKPGGAGMAAREGIDPVLISRALVEETLSLVCRRGTRSEQHRAPID